MATLEQRLTAMEKRIQDLKQENARLAKRVETLEKAVLPPTDLDYAIQAFIKGDKGPLNEYAIRGGTLPDGTPLISSRSDG
ncbi:MAG TPA: hypothetical protein PLO63_11625 [Syntrophales bacterium]|nr:hypothetical protein [Syntrophales bacterium]